MSTETAGLQQFKAQLGGPVPWAYGYVRGRGTKLAEVFYKDATYGEKTCLQLYLLGRGEWDALEWLEVNKKRADPTNTALVHFHAGAEGTLGGGMAMTSVGPDQGVDSFWDLLPDGLTPVTLSGYAYLFIKVPPDPGAPDEKPDVVGDYRTTKVRIFDNTGTQTAYQFSTNNAWEVHDFLLRTRVKRDGTANAALSAAEKARFDFQSFVDRAAYCDVVNGAGYKRFEGSLAWPRVISETQALEQMLLMGRMYLIERRGKFILKGDDARASVFTIRPAHVVPGSLQIDKADIWGAANQIVAHYNDLDLPKLGNITSIARATNVVTVVLDHEHGLKKDDWPTLVNAPAGFSGEFKVKDVPNTVTFRFDQAGANATPGATGYVGHREQKFTPRSPVKPHTQAQNSVGARGAGLTVMAEPKIIEFDLGNNVADRVDRLLEYIKIRNLGVDAAPYSAPFQGQVELAATAFDTVANEALMNLVEGDLVTLDPTLTDEFAGDFEIIDSKPSHSQRGKAGTIKLALKQYISAAFPDVAGATAVVVSPMARLGLVKRGGVAHGSYRPLSNSLTATDAGATATINNAAVDVRFDGTTPDPHYNSFAITGLAFGTVYHVYVDDPDLLGGDVSVFFSTTKEDALLLAGFLYFGSIATPNDGGPDTIGNNDGGAGAQIGKIAIAYPANAIADGWNNPANGIDGSTNSYADATTTSAVLTFEAYNFPQLNFGFATLVLEVKHQLVALASGNAFVKVTTDNGLNWSTIRTIVAADGAPVTTPFVLPVGQNTSLVRARVELPITDLSVGPSVGATAADTAGIGTVAWATPTNAQSSNDVYANFNSAVNNTTSHWLKITNFGFAVPAGATILGIKVEVEMNASDNTASDHVIDAGVKIVKGGVISGTDHKRGGTVWPLADTFVAFGGDADLWGVAWTPADINGVTFGVVIAAKITTISASSIDANIDSAKITVYYTTGAGATSGRVYEVTLKALG
jgi:hypothetical protein